MHLNAQGVSKLQAAAYCRLEVGLVVSRVPGIDWLDIDALAGEMGWRPGDVGSTNAMVKGMHWEAIVRQDIQSTDDVFVRLDVRD